MAFFFMALEVEFQHFGVDVGSRDIEVQMRG